MPEIAQEMGISIRLLERIRQAAQYPLSLEMELGEEMDSTLGDFIEDEHNPAPNDSTIHNLLRECINDVLECGDIQREVLPEPLEADRARQVASARDLDDRQAGVLLMFTAGPAGFGTAEIFLRMHCERHLFRFYVPRAAPVPHAVR